MKARYAYPLAFLTAAATGCGMPPVDDERTDGFTEAGALEASAATIYRGSIEVDGARYLIDLEVRLGEYEQTKRCHGERFRAGFFSMESLQGHAVRASIRDAGGELLGEEIVPFDIEDLGWNIPNHHCSADFTRFANDAPFAALGGIEVGASVPGVVVSTPSHPIALNGYVSQPIHMDLALSGIASFEATTAPVYSTFVDSEKLVVRGRLTVDFQDSVVVTVGHGPAIPGDFAGAPSRSSERTSVVLQKL